ncbi:hypothetical protein G9464_06555 [Halostella sp. JP-L12]|uniref:hypothetical protein n=1 Tax=Halostella TaxID=1843185 RepID=UPI000EF83032|nr:MULTISPECIES: hypothetical protein [Halostella]NHN47258.1 hypothetical protein [Halostella sp. JP-L12]
MSISGLCQICQSREAQVQCDRCGNMVCRQHFEESAAVCADCASEVEETGGGRTF